MFMYVELHMAQDRGEDQQGCRNDSNEDLGDEQMEHEAQEQAEQGLERGCANGLEGEQANKMNTSTPTMPANSDLKPKKPTP